MLSPFDVAAAFNQTEQGKQQGGKGTGLGLALVRQIVKRSGGRLGVKSRIGKGSTFWVELRTHSSLPPLPHLLTQHTDHYARSAWDWVTSDSAAFA
jgi:osomolarity two-component system, sensor histidine kinase SLN1